MRGHPDNQYRRRTNAELFKRFDHLLKQYDRSKAGEKFKFWRGGKVVDRKSIIGHLISYVRQAERATEKRLKS